MIYEVCISYIWPAAGQDKKPKMTPANNYVDSCRSAMMKLVTHCAWTHHLLLVQLPYTDPTRTV